MKYFSKFEIGLWCSSVVLILTSFFIFDKTNYLTLAHVKADVVKSSDTAITFNEMVNGYHIF